MLHNMNKTPDISSQLETAKMIEERSTKLIIWLLGLIGSGIIGLVSTHFFQVDKALRLIVVYLMPVLLLVALVLSIKLCKQAPSTTSYFLLVIGIFSILGGAAFDIVATVLHSPTLAREANLIAVGLFKTGHSIQFVYVYGLICQALLAATGAFLWVAFVKHRPVFLTVMFGSQPETFGEFIKACSGGQCLTWRQFYFPMSLKEVFSYKPYPLFGLELPYLLVVVCIVGI